MIEIIKETLKKDFIFELVEKVPIIVLLLDKNAKIIYFNKYFESLSGYSLKEVQGKVWFDIFIPDSIKEEIKKVFYGKLKNMPEYEKYQNEIKIKNNEIRIIQWYNFNQKKYENLYSILSLGVDITDQIEKEKHIKMLNTAIEQVKNGVMMTDIDGNITYVNEYMEKLTGYKKEELIGKNPRILKSNYYPKEVYEELWRIITSGQTWESYFYNKRKDGTYYWEKAVISPIFDDGVIKGYIGIKQDYTETYNLIKALDDLADNLEEIVKKRTIDLKKTLEELEREKNAREKAEKILIQKSKMEAIGSFTSGIVHDMKNIINKIKIYNELIEINNKSNNINDENIKEYCSQINQIISKAEEYMSSILNFGKTIDETKKIFINELINKILVFVSKTILKNIKIESFLSSEDICIEANKEEIEHVIINIITNAKDAIGEKNGNITIITENVLLEKEKAIEKNLKEGNYALIEICNDGPKIPESIIQKIFDPYFTTKKDGTGLGLSFSLSIVTKYNGIIIVESNDEKTCFKIYLPSIFRT